MTPSHLALPGTDTLLKMKGYMFFSVVPGLEIGELYYLSKSFGIWCKCSSQKHENLQVCLRNNLESQKSIAWHSCIIILLC